MAACKRTCTFFSFYSLALLGLSLAVVSTSVSAREIREEIIITATKMPRTQDEIAGTVSVISDEEMRSQLVTDLDDIVNYQPGVTMNYSERGGNQGFIIRGIGGNRVQTLVDGVRSNDIYSAGPSAYGRDLYEVDDLQSVEIIHGPASVLYGADAMGGVVLLNTKTPRDYTGGGDGSFLRARVGSDSATDLLKTGWTAGVVRGDFEVLAQYTHRDYAERDVNGPGELNPQDGSADNLLLKGIWSPTAKHQLTATLDGFQESIDTKLLNDLSSSVQDSRGIDESERYRFSLAHHWNAEALIADTIATQLYWQRADALQDTDQLRTSYAFINPMNPATYGGTLAQRSTDFEFNQKHRGVDVTLQKAFATGALQHSSVFGLQWDRSDTERPRNRCDRAVDSREISCAIPSYPFAVPEEFPNKTFPDTETTRSGVFWQNEMRLANSPLTLIPGLRYDHYEMQPHRDGLLVIDGYEVVAVEEDEATFNFGALYTLSDSVTLFAQYAEGFRPPNYDEANQAFVNLGHGYATVPNPDLEPEYSDGIEFGVKANFAATSVNLVLYNNHYENFIESQFIGTQNGIMLYQDSNVGEASIRGAELSSLWRANDNWQVTFGLAYARGENDITDQALDSVEPLTGVVGLAFAAADKRWGVESLLTAVAEKNRVSADDRATNDSYALVDLTAYYKLSEQLSLRTGLFNVFDEEYARWANIQGLLASNTDGIERAHAPGRSVRVNISYQF